MTSAGETLRRERLKRKLNLDQISLELKISGRLLEAIESDQYDRLPGGVFAKAFVRQYACLLGLDGEELATQVQRAMDPPTPHFAEKSRPAVIPIGRPKVEEWRGGGNGRFQLSGSLPAAVLVVVVMLICSAVYAWMQRPRTTATAQATPPASIRIDPAPAPVSAPPPQPAATEPAPSTPITTPTTPAPVPAALPASKPVESARVSAPTTSAGPVHVEVVADKTVWMLARVDGKFAFSGTMEPNDRRTIDAEKDVLLRLGNAGNVTISLNGKPIGPAGPKGQVRTLQFTSGGFQIVSVKLDPPVPFDPLDRL